MGTHREFTAGPSDHGRRLDRVLKAFLTLPGSHLHRALRKGDIRLNGARSRPHARVSAGDVISVYEALLSRDPPDGREDVQGAQGHGTEARAELSRQARIVYEDEQLLALNKERGVLVHGENSLAEAVHAYLQASGLLRDSLSFTPGPLHRLDRNTSGLIVFSKAIDGARDVSEAIRAGRVQKHYLALIDGRPAGPQRWEDPLIRDEDAHVTRVRADGRPALTLMRPLLHTGSTGDGLTLCKIRIVTGITHQIRAHAAAHGHPLSGDSKYGSRKDRRKGYLLHAVSMEFPQECGVASGLVLTADLPAKAESRLVDIFGGAVRDVLTAGFSPSA